MNKILIYCRESRDDNFENYERIELQAKMLVDYANKQNLGEIVEIIMDDNMTGTDFKRLEPIKEMIIHKKFDTFLCKDCSRIGRNLLESLKFIEFLNKYNINLVFLSEEYDEDLFPIKAWFNQLRAKDDSKKIQQVLDNKKYDGTLLIKAPYGYYKINNNLIPDSNTKDTITYIYDLFISGMSIKNICDHLNRNKIKTPSMHKPEYLKKSYKWTNQQIIRILKNEIYTGKMIYNKKVKQSCASKHYRTNDKSNWIIIDNHHEPIISKEIFEKAQSLLLKPRTRNINENIFSNKIYCGICGSVMYKKIRKNYSPYFVCKNYNAYGTQKCELIKVYEHDLITSINDYILSFLNHFSPEEINTILNDYDNRRNKSIKTKEKYEQKLLNLYEDKQNELINDFIYLQKQNEYRNIITQETAYLNKINQKELHNSNFNNILLQLNNLTLTNEIINIFINKIEIHKNLNNNENEILFI